MVGIWKQMQGCFKSNGKHSIRCEWSRLGPWLILLHPYQASWHVMSLIHHDDINPEWPLPIFCSMNPCLGFNGQWECHSLWRVSDFNLGKPDKYFLWTLSVYNNYLDQSTYNIAFISSCGSFSCRLKFSYALRSQFIFVYAWHKNLI